MILGLGAFLIGLPTAPERAPDSIRILRTFISEGPDAGAWEIQSPRGLREYVVIDAPGNESCVFLGRRGDDESELESVRVVPRARAARWFLPGRADLFLRNYRLTEERWEEHEDGEVLLGIWEPREQTREGPVRWVWVDVAEERVVLLEDRSCQGGSVRRVERVGDVPLGLEVTVPAAGERQACQAQAPFEPGRPSLNRLDREAPFVVLAPRKLPRGFALVEAAYRTPRCSPDEPGAGIAWLVYSDGLASFSLAMGEQAGLAALARRFAEGEGCHVEDDATLPGMEEPDRVAVRRYRDPCRLVLRVDEFRGVGVVLIGQNEIPESEYLAVLASLAPTRGD